jgi:hypothetical protein
MIGCPSKLVPIGFELPLGGFMRGHLRSHHTYHLSSFSRSSIPLDWFGHWVGQISKGCTLPCGKKGLKAQRVKVAGKRQKTKE